MKIIIINKTDVQGGAAIAANRIKNALCSVGESAKMLVQKKLSDDKSVHQNSEGKWARSKEFVLFIAERLFFYFYEKSKMLRFAFSPAVAGENISKNPLINEADIVHIHWFNQGFLSLKSLKKLLKLNKPIVWTLHDMWAFTGGCHYSGDCENYKTGCGNCKFLKNANPGDLSNRIFGKKSKILKNATIQFVTCSNWLAQKAKESALLRNFNIISIPNPIDTGLYFPKNKQKIREKLALPLDKKLVLFGAANIMDERKGLKYLLSALKKLKEENSEIGETLEIVLFGKSDANFIKQIPFKVHDMGVISGDSNIVDIYNAADIFVLPSLEDNLPNTIMEAMACGTPVVAYKTGGIPEMIEHKVNGYIAEYKSIDDLKDGVKYLLEYSNADELSKNAVDRVYRNYNQTIVVDRYKAVYQSFKVIV
jgi:glycosyltransferase involved in cell wall biosynthesis